MSCGMVVSHNQGRTANQWYFIYPEYKRTLQVPNMSPVLGELAFFFGIVQAKPIVSPEFYRVTKIVWFGLKQSGPDQAPPSIKNEMQIHGDEPQLAALPRAGAR